MSYLKPSFFILGERKCGTSSLFRYLLEHPHILPGKWKEPQFFSKHSPAYIAEHIDEYWSLFPKKEGEEQAILTWPELDREGNLFEEKVHFERKNNAFFITGEASANSFCEVNPSLLFQYLPEIKFILLFRDPAARAFSHHRMFLRFQEEGRVLGRKIEDFETEIDKEITAHQKGKTTFFIEPGLYIKQLKKWRAIFPKNQFRIYFSHQLASPDSARELLSDIQNYLNLPLYHYTSELDRRYNQAPQASMSKEIEQKLRSFYRPYNKLLAQYVEKKLPSSWSEKEKHL